MEAKKYELEVKWLKEGKGKLAIITVENADEDLLIQFRDNLEKAIGMGSEFMVLNRKVEIKYLEE